jgi:S1-C subfamily serine protease
MIATSATVDPGQSGGPLVDARGRVIAMLESGDGPGTGYATPIDRALRIARQIASGEPSPYLVIGRPAVLGAAAKDAGGRPGGAEVTSVHAGTPAVSMGLRPGDVITRLDDASVTSALVLARTLVRYRPGDRALIGWTGRFGVRHTAGATLAAGPAP